MRRLLASGMRRRHDAGARLERGRCARRAPSSSNVMPPWRASTRGAPAGPRQQRGLRQRLGLDGGRRERGHGDEAGERRLGRSTDRAGGGATSPSAPRQMRERRPDVATAPSRTVKPSSSVSPVNGCSTSTSRAGAGVAADAQVAAAVDGPVRVARRAASRARSAAWPLPVPPVSMRRPGGRVIVPASSSTEIVAPARVPASATPARRGTAALGERRAQVQAPGSVPGLAVAGGLEVVEERRVDEPAGELARPRAPRGPRCAADPTRGPSSRGSAFSAQSSESGLKRESARVVVRAGTRSTASAAAASGDGRSRARRRPDEDRGCACP